MKAAIVGLVRGHERIESYSKLIRRNRLLHRHFNKRFDYPVILFHEGNVRSRHQSVLSSITPHLRFVDVSDQAFIEPRGLHPEWEGVGTERLGYKHMCRFYATQIWDFVAEYDYIMRLDDDSFIESRIEYDIFKFMREEGLDYGYVHAEHDYHEQTVDTLPAFTRRYIRQNDIPANCWPEEIDAEYYYSNFLVARVSFWLEQRVQAFLQDVDESLGIYQYRWGDHVIQTHALKIFSTPEKQHHFQDFRYSHGSHRWSNYEPTTLDRILRRMRKIYRRRFERRRLRRLVNHTATH